MRKSLLCWAVLLSLFGIQSAQASRALTRFHPERLVFSLYPDASFRDDPIRKLYDKPVHTELSISEFLVIQSPSLIIPVDDISQNSNDRLWIYTLSRSLRQNKNNPFKAAVVTRNNPDDLIEVVGQIAATSFIYVSDPYDLIQSFLKQDFKDGRAFVLKKGAVYKAKV